MSRKVQLGVSRNNAMRGHQATASCTAGQGGVMGTGGSREAVKATVTAHFHREVELGEIVE